MIEFFGTLTSDRPCHPVGIGAGITAHPNVLALWDIFHSICVMLKIVKCLGFADPGVVPQTDD
jgi:hypothetical protein